MRPIDATLMSAIDHELRARALRHIRRGHSYVFATAAVGSILSGLLWFSIIPSSLDGTVVARQFGDAVQFQFIIWGLINAIFGFMGLRDARRFSQRPMNPEQADIELGEARSILGVLQFNAKLNRLWIAIGLTLLAAAGIWESWGLLGHGVGVTIQALWLVGFDASLKAKLKTCLKP
jgi:hypothetical protein